MSFNNLPQGGNNSFLSFFPHYSNINLSNCSSGIHNYEESLRTKKPPGLSVSPGYKASHEEKNIYDQSNLGQITKMSNDSATKERKLMNQRLLENFGESSLNDNTNSLSKTSLKELQSTAHSSFTTDMSFMGYSVNDLLNQSRLNHEMSVLSSSVNSTFMESKNNQASKGLAEETMEAIEKKNINCIPLLNEVGSKVKKQVDTLIKEVTVNKNKQFQCAYTLGGEIIGFGKGVSKIDAKLKAAEASIKTLLQEEYSAEKAFIILSVQKKMNDPEVTNSKFEQTPSESFQSYKPTLEEAGNSEKEFPNDSSLYQLNLICKMNFIEPRWTLQKPTGSNEYEAQVSFHGLNAIGKGSRKLEAKRNAAAKLIEKINSDKDLKNKYDITNKPSKKKENKNSSRQEKIKQLFEQSMSAKMLTELQEQSHAWVESIKHSENEFEAYLAKLIKRLEIKEDTINALVEFFTYVSSFTSNLNVQRPDESDNITNYISNCSLTLIGSFALDCMRQDKLSIDAALIFQEVKKVSELELLQLYQKFLNKSQEEFLMQNPSSKYRMKFGIEKTDRGYTLSVMSDVSLGNMKLNIQVSDPQTKSCKLAIHHVKRIYDCFENSEHLNKLRTLMMLLRLWRAKNDLQFFPPELLDTTLLNEFIANNSLSIACLTKNCLAVLNSAEEIFKAMLEKFGPQYLELYKNIPQKLKYKVINLSGENLEAIHKSDFDEIF